MTFYEMILQSEFLMMLFITVGSSIFIWLLFWFSVMLTKFLAKVNGEETDGGKGAE